MSHFREEFPRRWRTALAGGAFVILAVGLGITLKSNQVSGAPSAVDAPLKPSRGVLDLQDSISDVAEVVGKSVVHIETRLKIRGQVYEYYDPLDQLEEWFGRRRQRNRQRFQEPDYELEGGIGTGVVVREDGFILTNRHVIAPYLQAIGQGESGEIKVTIQIGGKQKKFNGELKGYRSNPDLAVIKISAKGLPTIRLGDSDKVRVGEWAIAVGNPFGYDNTVTAGIVSAKYRELRTDTGTKLRNLIQTDAAINPGNSGGPLANIFGEVIGINVAIASGGVAQSAGIGFAIPANDVKAILENLLKGKGDQENRERRPWMGVSLRDGDEEQDGVKEGVVIDEVVEGSPAIEAGLRARDVILTFEGKKVKTTEDVIDEIQRRKVGEKVTLSILRNKKELIKEVALGVFPEVPEKTSRRRTFWP